MWSVKRWMYRHAEKLIGPSSQSHLTQRQESKNTFPHSLRKKQQSPSRLLNQQAPFYFQKWNRPNLTCHDLLCSNFLKTFDITGHFEPNSSRSSEPVLFTHKRLQKGPQAYLFPIEAPPSKPRRCAKSSTPPSFLAACSNATIAWSLARRKTSRLPVCWQCI